jgi:hypothetical protein
MGAKRIGCRRYARNIIQEQTAKGRVHCVQRSLHFELENTDLGLDKRKNQRAIGLWSHQVIKRGNQRLCLAGLPSVSRSFLESDEMEENERSVSRNDSRRCLHNEPLHRCLFGLLENSCTSPTGIYYRYGRVVLASTWGREKRMNNIAHIDGILLFVMPVVSLDNPF